MRSEDKVRDPIHDFIRFDRVEKEIIDTREFQRLRNIKQLSFCYYVYPGAMHSRFEHSLGVMELATQYFDCLDHDRHPDRKTFRSIYENEDKRKEARRTLRLAALLHDVGHLPYSHTLENILPQDQDSGSKLKHEDVSVAIIRETKIEEIIKKAYGADEIKRITRILTKEELLHEDFLLRQIISGEFDADRMDYLIRDSHHCGVSYGKFDYHRLLESLRLYQDDDENYWLTIERGGVHCLEALILARYFMFAQVYFHRTRRMYDYYLNEFLNESKMINISRDKLTDVLNYDDLDVWRKIEKFAKSGKSIWAKRIYNRGNHHSLIYETDDHADPKEDYLVYRATESLKKDFKDLDIFIDSCMAPIHNFYTGQHGKKYKPENDLQVILKDGTPKSICEESSWLNNGPKEFRCIRVYALSNKPEKEKRESRIEEAKKKFKENMDEEKT